MKSSLRKISFVLLGLLFITAGCLHFTNPKPFESIVPSYLPAALTLVYISGFFEILGGLGLLIPALRRPATWGLIALLFAVFPANIYMVTDHPYLMDARIPAWVLWLRLPLQFILMAWLWWTNRTPAEKTPS